MADRIGMVVYDDIGFLDVVGPSDVFTTANQIARSALYNLAVVAAGRPAYVRAESGLRLGTDVDLVSTRRRFDTVLVAGGLGFRAAMRSAPLIKGARRLCLRAQRFGSICTGAFVLAAAGLLEDRRATTHWAYADQLQELFPKTRVVADELYVTDGSVVTAAGVAAGIDLALALIERDHGAELARSVSRRMVVYFRRAGGQSQFSERFSSNETSSAGVLDDVLAEITSDPARDHTVEVLARRAAMSRRHFARVFRQTTGTTPARWVERVRVDAAREMLETGSLPVERIAEDSGFGSIHTMRQAFQRVVGLSPARYRATHAAKPAERS